jgi:collagenase-like PrtC family protease
MCVFASGRMLAFPLLGRKSQQRAEIRGQKPESRYMRAEIREQRVESRGDRAESIEQRTWSKECTA